ncbi:hypothetical protein ASE61_14070 [Bosea sp. Root670]|nr:hypothetical protein ASE61_14070 [Bosea sp. Root670]
MRGPVGGCGFGDVGETDGALKRKTVAKVKFRDGFPCERSLLMAVMLGLGPSISRRSGLLRLTLQRFSGQVLE